MRISIALCTYNGRRHVEELLQSIAIQSVQPDEMFISDDASSDGTVALLEYFAKSQSFPVHINKSGLTRGVNKNYEYTLGKCTGDLIFIADQDDVWDVNKIQILSDIAIQADHCAVFSNAEMIDDQGVALKSNIWDYFQFEHDKDSNNEYLIQRTLLSNIVTGSTLALKKEVLKWILPFPSSDLFLYDEWLALILLTLPHRILVPCETPVMKYRMHERQFTAKLRTSVEPKFPFNWELNFTYIERKQQLLEMVKLHLAISEHSNPDLD